MIDRIGLILEVYELNCSVRNDTKELNTFIQMGFNVYFDLEN